MADRLSYHTSTNIWLHLEYAYNRGMTPDEARAVIERVPVGRSGERLHCQPSGLNGNWIVDVPFREVITIAVIAHAVEMAIFDALGDRAKGLARPRPPFGECP
jgi:hypothetical protein